MRFLKPFLTITGWVTMCGGWGRRGVMSERKQRSCNTVSVGQNQILRWLSVVTGWLWEGRHFLGTEFNMCKCPCIGMKWLLWKCWNKSNVFVASKRENVEIQGKFWKIDVGWRSRVPPINDMHDSNFIVSVLEFQGRILKRKLTELFAF